uniref:NADH-ubiquinone oxidoreductase chain 1 n=2 Tax=unclassified Nephtys TaxID=2628724 RepID=B2C6Q8_9ANNE
MILSFSTHILLSYVMALLAMAFFTLLERKVLGYIQLRKGPNKVGIMGLPQPLADAAKLLTKEQTFPSLANWAPYLFAPTIGLFLALMLWSMFPHGAPTLFIKFGVLFFLCVSSINVYVTLGAGWASNSKYALLGAIRAMAQTISYEVSMSLTLLGVLVILTSFNMTLMHLNSYTPMILLSLPLSLVWFTTTLAETNRTPFDFAEGESELVSGFNTEYSSGTFAMIFMAEYTNILVMSLFSTIFFFSLPFSPLFKDLYLTFITLLVAFAFLWIRGSLPRMRYDRLMNLTWKGFLPFALMMLMFNIPLNMIFMW